MTGATGLIGSALLPALSARGHQVFRVTRSSSQQRAGDIQWDPERRQLDAAALEGINVVIHLAGESVAQRWTEARRNRILESRVRGTRLLSETLARLQRPPSTLISASAVGYYGVHADGPVDEDSPAGNDFLADVVKQWEAAADPARAAGIRVVHPRTGIVLSRKGGALARMLPFFRLGLGGRLGNGRQWMSWVSMHDLVRALEHLIADASIRGAANVAAPAPVRNAEFAKILGRVLHRPAFFPVPSLVLKLVYGAMAKGTILASQRVVPRVLTERGFRFEHSSLDDALRHELSAAT